MDYSLAMLTDELALAKKLRALGEGNIFAGSTHFSDRKERARAFINHVGREVVFTVKDGKRISLEDQFILVYACDL